MFDSYYVAIYWPPREAGLDSVVRDIVRTFDALIGLDPAFGRWFEKGRSRRLAEAKEFDRSEVGLRRKLARANPIDQKLKVGYQLAVWNGSSSGLSMRIGSTAKAVTNNVVLRIDEDKGIYDIPPERAREALLNLVSIWKPRWGAVSTSEWRAAQSDRQTSVAVGWSTYLKTSQLPVTMPSKVTVKSVSDGVLVDFDAPFSEVRDEDVVELQKTLVHHVSAP